MIWCACISCTFSPSVPGSPGSPTFPGWPSRPCHIINTETHETHTQPTKTMVLVHPNLKPLGKCVCLQCPMNTHSGYLTHSILTLSPGSPLQPGEPIRPIFPWERKTEWQMQIEKREGVVEHKYNPSSIKTSHGKGSIDWSRSYFSSTIPLLFFSILTFCPSVPLRPARPPSPW